MSVRIGHASIAETGGVNGRPGDQTGREVCTRSWYSAGWSFMAIHPDASVRDRHAKAVEAACANDCVGYSQNDRNSLYRQALSVGMDISKIRTACSCDCSSLQNCAAVASGAPGVSYGENGWVTTNMLQHLRAAGYVIVDDPYTVRNEQFAVRGAIYVSEGHTVCALDNGEKSALTLTAAGIKDTCSEQKEDPAEETGAGDYKLPLHVLRRGMKGDEVKAAQILLIGWGCSCGPDGADGDFGPATEGAAMKFQWQHNLTVDGVIGPLTMAALHGLSK